MVYAVRHSPKHPNVARDCIRKTEKCTVHAAELSKNFIQNTDSSLEVKGR